MKYTDISIRPIVSPPDFTKVPETLKNLNIWVLWKFDVVKDRWAKVPYYSETNKASTTNPATWMPFDEAKRKYESGKFDGVGCVINESFGIVGIDIDDCITDGVMDSKVKSLLTSLDTYSEISPSGTGVHILGFTGLRPNTRGEVSGLKVELYSNARYFTFTGNTLNGHRTLTDITEVVSAMVNTLTKPNTSVISSRVDSILERLRSNPKLEKLFEGDLSAYDFDQSRVDMAVVSAIARLANNDMALIDAVFRQTPFYRPKWDESRGNGKTYGLKTIEKIVQSRVFITSSDSETSHVSVADVWDSVKTYRRSGGARGFHPGWDELEVYYRPTLGSLTVLVGEPSSGKSTFIDCLTLKMARKHGWKFCMASFETLPIERHINSLCQAYIGKPTYEFMEGCATDEEMDEAGEFLDKHYRFLLPSDNEMDMGSILKNVREEVIDFGVKGFVLDPFTELNMPISSGLSEVRLIEHQLRKLQQFTRVMEIHTWLLVHPTKSSENYITSDKIKRPSLYSASGAAHFRNKADFGLVIHRIEGDRVNLYIDKVRYDSAGGNGMVSFMFDKNKKEYFPTLPDSDW